MGCCNCGLTRCIGSCGLGVVGCRREVIVTGLGGFLALCCLVFGIVGCVGLSSNGTVIKSCNWAHYTVFGKEVYMNLVAIRYPTADTYEVRKWSEINFDAFCTTPTFLTVDNRTRNGDCRLGDCQDSAQDQRANQVITTVSSLAALNMCVLRGNAHRDNGCWKLISLLTLAVGLSTALGSLGSFASDCKDNFDDFVDTMYGPGFFLPMVACICQGFIWIIMALCPAPCKDDDEEKKGIGTRQKQYQAVEQSSSEYLQMPLSHGGALTGCQAYDQA